MDNRKDVYDDINDTDDNVSIDEALVENAEDAERLLGITIDSDDGDLEDPDDDGDPDIFEN
ncbi:MAG: hypothetical protein LBB07_01145 [Bifidobacteriaceae bacterium]|jgi:hypothetical protein|nr:hypothetical protein [Bifidobacteriaceae bacterium]